METLNALAKRIAALVWTDDTTQGTINIIHLVRTDSDGHTFCLSLDSETVQQLKEILISPTL